MMMLYHGIRIEIHALSEGLLYTERREQNSTITAEGQ